MSNMKDNPGFFKFFQSSKSSERLRIPLAFAAHVKGGIPDTAFLRSCNGELWQVEVTKDRNDLFFTNGWETFVEDNSVELGDFLVFDYIGNWVFDFKVLGRTGCNKDVVEEKDEEYKEGEGEGEEELEANALIKKREKGRGTNNLLDSGGYKGKAIANAEIEEDEDVFKSGIVSRPKNPYFVAKLRKKRQNELHVPADVIKDHKLKLPQTLILLDEEGRKWSAKVVGWKDGRIWLAGGGWRAFCKWNDVQWEDRCICEFMQGKGRQGLYLKMHILKAGSWFPKTDQSHG
ncbi:B3 domain-containing protein [Actinidia chinensis var. chinensis]|uniref:B3 domain-containing protein n=1 Tax=Actinidia chinensis var. chinensis TaxID=1590841 RepID=A0A2R6Q5M4_ACTCC|nr:B3 domain-containing protein [Actinidia chinensis var. chinensis]